MKKFYVVYSINKQLGPKVYKSLTRIKTKLIEDQNLAFQSFDSQLKAQQFAHVERMKYLGSEEKLNKNKSKQSKQNPLIKKVQQPKPKAKKVTPKKPTKEEQLTPIPQGVPNTEYLKSQISSLSKAEEYKTMFGTELQNKTFNIAEISNQSLNKKKLIDEDEFNSFNFAGFKNKHNKIIGFNNEIIENVKKVYQNVLKFQGSNKFVKSMPKREIRPDVEYTGFFDGCSKNNPGPSGAGYVVVGQKNRIFQKSVNLGYQTNNQAEFYSLLFCLLDCKFNNIRKLRVFGDSNLAVKGIKGQYNIQDSKIKYINLFCQHITQSFTQFQIIHIPRENNVYADKLSVNALKLKYLGTINNSLK